MGKVGRARKSYGLCLGFRPACLQRGARCLVVVRVVTRAADRNGCDKSPPECRVQGVPYRRSRPARVAREAVANLMASGRRDGSVRGSQDGGDSIRQDPHLLAVTFCSQGPRICKQDWVKWEMR